MKQVEGWRHINEETGELYPWYVKPALELLDSMDLKDKIVYEYGVGDSSLWWAKRCKKLYGVESNPYWANIVNKKIGDIATIRCNPNFIKYTEDFKAIDTKDPELYINDILKHKVKFDIVIIDGLDREECVEPAISCMKSNSVLIYDNWMQPSVTVQSEETQKRLLAYEHKIFSQEGHDDWKTAIFYIP